MNTKYFDINNDAILNSASYPTEMGELKGKRYFVNHVFVRSISTFEWFRFPRFRFPLFAKVQKKKKWFTVFRFPLW